MIDGKGREDFLTLYCRSVQAGDDAMQSQAMPPLLPYRFGSRNENCSATDLLLHDVT